MCDLQHLSRLAKTHIECKFLKMNAEKAPFFVQKLVIRVLPTVVCFKDGVAFPSRVVGFEGLTATDEDEESATFGTRGHLTSSDTFPTVAVGATNSQLSDVSCQWGTLLTPAVCCVRCSSRANSSRSAPSTSTMLTKTMSRDLELCTYLRSQLQREGRNVRALYSHRSYHSVSSPSVPPSFSLSSLLWYVSRIAPHAGQCRNRRRGPVCEHIATLRQRGVVL